jgi:undecaprenyl-diphosphatase
MILEFLKAILFGIVEGITEWLPISSTGHMILLNEILPLRVGDDPDAFYSMFEVVIQFGAILAVVLLFWKKIWPFGKKDNAKPLAKDGAGAWIKWDIIQLWFHILVSCIPAAIVGVLFDEQLEALFYNYQTVAIMLILFGIAFIIVENINHGKRAKVRSLSEITYFSAFLIGMFQLIAAIFPGTSRSGATIVGALLIGVSRSVSAEYTFFLAIPVMFGASLLKLVKFGFDFSAGEAAILLTAMAVAFLVSVFVIRFLMDYIRKHDFKVFGWYRIVLGAVVLAAGIAGVI